MATILIAQLHAQQEKHYLIQWPSKWNGLLVLLRYIESKVVLYCIALLLYNDQYMVGLAVYIKRLNSFLVLIHFYL